MEYPLGIPSGSAQVFLEKHFCPLLAERVNCALGHCSVLSSVLKNAARKCTRTVFVCFFFLSNVSVKKECVFMYLCIVFLDVD